MVVAALFLSPHLVQARGHANTYDNSNVNQEVEHVNAYTKSDGTYVQEHERTRANDTKSDNYSTKGNVNPYTGASGTK